MKNRKIITWLLVLAMTLSLFSVAALADEPEAGEAAGTEAAEEAEEPEEPAEPETGTEEPVESTEPTESEGPTETEEESVSEEPSLLLGSAVNGGIVLASDDNSENVAYIGTTGYTTLAAAITAANKATEAVTIKLNDDVTITSSQLISNTSAAVTLDLNGHSITGAISLNNAGSGGTTYALRVGSGANLTVTDTSTGKNGYISVTYSTSNGSGSNGIYNLGTLNIADGTIYATSVAIYNYGGSLNVTGGTISCTGDLTTRPASGITNYGGGSISVSGGTISATSPSTQYASYGIEVSSGGGSIEVSGGTITGGTIGIACTWSSSAVTLNVSGGTISSSGNGVTVSSPYGVVLYNGYVTITDGEITSTNGTGVWLYKGSFSMSKGSVSGGTNGVVLYSYYGAITGEITGGEITGNDWGVYARAGSSYSMDLTIGGGSGTPVITSGDSSSCAGLAVRVGAKVTVKSGTISGGYGMHVVENTTAAPSTLIIEGEVTVSATSADGEAVYGTGTNGSDMIITVSDGTYNTQVASGYLADDVTQITYDGTGLYYVDTPTAQASRIEAVIAAAELDTAVNTVEITVTDGDLELTGISTTSTDVHITNESTGTVSVSNTTLGNETVSFHVLTKTEAVAATCEDSGNEAYWTCRVCGQIFSDSEGKNVTSLADMTTPSTGHTYGEPTFTWAADGKSATATYTCEEGDDTQTVTADVTSAVKTAATCTAMGTTTYTATVTVDGVEYSETKDVEDIPANGHSFGAWETVTSPTCEDDGSEQRVCNLCGYIETQGVDPTGHQWEAEYTIDKAATCTTDGSQSIHCANCDAVKDSQTIPATGHSYGEAAFTWSEDGKSAEASFTCETCGDVQTAKAAVTSAVKTAATETEAGVTVYTATVTFNGVEYTATKELADIPATGTSGDATPSPTATATATPEPTATAVASPTSTAPSTGDEESPMLWAALVVLCAAGLGAALPLTRKGRGRR